jgi:heme/copper-type cytochrome/quinol oxidase subunit 3
LTLVLGLAFVNSAAYLFTQMGAAIARSVPELLLYAVGGFHITTFIVAMVFVTLMAFRALGGQYSGRDSEGVAAAAVFWDTAVLLYIVSWYAVYVTK